MKRSFTIAASAVLAFGALSASTPVQAQQLLYYDGFGQPICSGPFGPGPCAAVQQYLQQQAMAQQSGLPGAGLLPQDGQIVAGIYQTCGGEPRCMAAAWGAVEVQRCRNGVGVPGGCFGPNGEIMKVVNRFLPQNLHPNVILRNIDHDLHQGAGSTNDAVGCDGWLAHRVGVHC